MSKDPYIKVTFLGKGYGIRLFYPNGKLHSEDFVKTRIEVGPAARSLLRWWDKLGGDSWYAHRARHRQGEKEVKRKCMKQ